MPEYAAKHVHDIASGEIEQVALTSEEIAERDALQAEAEVAYEAEQARQQRVQTAITFLASQDYKAANDAIKSSQTLSNEEKLLFSRLIKGQAALVQILRQIGQDIDLSQW